MWKSFFPGTSFCAVRRSYVIFSATANANDEKMNPLDLEQSAPLRRRPVRPPNTATDGDNVSSFPMGPPGLPAHHPLNILKRSAIISGTLYALYGALSLIALWRVIG